MLDHAMPVDIMDFPAEAILAFIANEGAFLLRSFNLFELTQEEWQAIFRDIEELLA